MEGAQEDELMRERRTPVDTEASLTRSERVAAARHFVGRQRNERSGGVNTETIYLSRVPSGKFVVSKTSSLKPKKASA